MKLISATNQKKILYNKNLSYISGIKFTLREIDILSCIMHNRGEKKIGSLLSISHRTVGVHTRNIMIKIGASSRDDLIDYLERCKKSDYFREYYFLLVAGGSFEKFLYKITAIINRQHIKCSAFFNNLTEEENNILDDIKNHLGMANIHLNYPSEIDYEHNIYFIGKDFVKTKRSIRDEDIIINFDSTPNNSVSSDKNSINFTRGQNYYFTMIKIIKKFIKNDNLTALIADFTEEYKSLYSSKKSINCKMLPQKNNINYTDNFSILRKDLKYLLLFIIALIISISLFLTYYINSTNFSDNEFNSNEFNKLMTNHLHSFSADNVQINQFIKNHEIVKGLEKILDHQNRNHIEAYFSDASIPPQSLLNYLHNVQALASYYLYNQHDGDRANKLLFYVKKLMEDYANSTSRIKVDFEDKINPKEILAELKIIKNFPQIYTRIVYMLARSFIYKGEAELGRKYFIIAKALGNHLSLFEGYLSETSGLLILDNIKSKNYIKNNEIKEAKILIQNIIDRYQKMESLNCEYIKDFKLQKLKQEYINPNRDLYSKFDRLHSLLNCYNQLIKISTTEQQKVKYADLLAILLDKFFNKNSLKNISDKINTRKIAVFYNNFGNSYLVLENYKSNNLNRILKKHLDIEYKDNQAVAIELYTHAKHISRNMDFTKADAYDGLAKSYEIYLKQLEAKPKTAMVQKEINLIAEQIKLCKNKSKQINKALNRQTN